MSALTAAAVCAPAGAGADPWGHAGACHRGGGGAGVLYHLPLALADALGYFRVEGLEVVVRDFAAGALAQQWLKLTPSLILLISSIPLFDANV